ncbi:hypothetical protein AC519_3161 [Pseudomonas savastanoi]|nr:hypothetical protein AC519_3161 [Pseudomonas savastanoi]
MSKVVHLKQCGFGRFIRPGVAHMSKVECLVTNLFQAFLSLLSLTINQECC